MGDGNGVITTYDAAAGGFTYRPRATGWFAAPRAPARCGRRRSSGKWPSARPPRGSSRDRKSTRLNSSHDQISYAVFCLKKKKNLERMKFSEIYATRALVS